MKVWIAMASILLVQPFPAESTTTWEIGDVFLGVAGGSYQVRQPDGTLKETLTTGRGGFTTGCAFDQDGNLFVTEFTANNVSKFLGPTAPHTNSLFGTGYSTPESIVFDAAGNVYVGNLGNGILQFASDGTFIKTVINTRVDWFDIAADQDTILFTQEGADIKTTSISAGGLGTDFTTGTATNAFAIRILPDGGALLADLFNVKRYNAAGAVVDTYDVSGEDSWFSLNLAPDGTSFYAGNFTTGNYYRFSIATGGLDSHIAGPFSTGAPGNLFGICVFGEITVAIPRDIALAPTIATNSLGAVHTVTASVEIDNNPASGILVNFEVTAGPNVGQVSDPNSGECTSSDACTTDGNGQVSWSYTGNGGPGEDTIVARFTDNGHQQSSAPVSKLWVEFDPFGGIVRTSSRQLRLTLTRPSPDVDGVRCVETTDPQNPDFDDIPFTPFPNGEVEIEITLSEEEGTKTVCCEYRKTGGEVFPPICDGIELRFQAPPLAAPVMSPPALAVLLVSVLFIGIARLRRLPG